MIVNQTEYLLPSAHSLGIGVAAIQAGHVNTDVDSNIDWRQTVRLVHQPLG